MPHQSNAFTHPELLAILQLVIARNNGQVIQEGEVGNGSQPTEAPGVEKIRRDQFIAPS